MQMFCAAQQMQTSRHAMAIHMLLWLIGQQSSDHRLIIHIGAVSPIGLGVIHGNVR